MPISSHRMTSVRLFHDVSQCFKSVLWCFTVVYDVFLVVHDVSQCFKSVSWCFTMFDNYFMMFSEPHNDWCCRIGDCRSPQGSRQRCRIGDNGAGIGDNSAEIADAAGIVNIAAKVTPCWTPSWMETGVTLFLEDKFQRGH